MYVPEFFWVYGLVLPLLLLLELWHTRPRPPAPPPDDPPPSDG